MTWLILRELSLKYDSALFLFIASLWLGLPDRTVPGMFSMASPLQHEPPTPHHQVTVEHHLLWNSNDDAKPRAKSVNKTFGRWRWLASDGALMLCDWIFAAGSGGWFLRCKNNVPWVKCPKFIGSLRASPALHDAWWVRVYLTRGSTSHMSAVHCCSTKLQNLTLILRVMWPFLWLMESEAFKWLHLMTLPDSFWIKQPWLQGLN